ncbi:hypothetical protein Tco_0977099 [Tanacetum coccineum]|uniref:Helitron helicase-like domain-containing protein n=1 Tax=Tanacetum coccineum TaxID=301880 RepID=A0ABQ5EJE1_9ASTR
MDNVLEKISPSDKLDFNLTSITAGAVRGSLGNIIHPNNSSKRTRTPTQLSSLSKQTAALVGSDCGNINLTPRPKARPRITDFSTPADAVVGTVINRIPTNSNNSKRTRTPTQVSPLSKGNDIFVSESTRIKSTPLPRGRLRLTDLSTCTQFQNVTPVGSLTFKSTIDNGTVTDKQTFNKTAAKGKSIRQKHESQFISQTPVTFDLESPSTEQVRLSSHQSSLLTSDRRQELKGKMATRQFSCSVVYTIEFQKRGLPHCHILLWLETEDKITTTGKIDEYISAEIPNKDEDPELYQLVTDHMMHGPCGADNPSCPCTIEYKCTKKFPRQFNETTVIDDSGYALYKRRNDGNIIKKSGTDLHKDGKEVDKIKDFLNCRYLSSCEAACRIYGFEIHYRTPSVERLPLHLKDEQQVIFDAPKSIDYAVDKSSVNETKFESWMELNQTDTFARTLLYVEIPKFYVWNQKQRI